MIPFKEEEIDNIVNELMGVPYVYSNKIINYINQIIQIRGMEAKKAEDEKLEKLKQEQSKKTDELETDKVVEKSEN